jgi:hypothetical protein
MERFARFGSIRHLGLGTEASEEAIRECVAALLAERAERIRMSEAGVALVDAHGAARAADVMTRGGLRGPANGGRRE